MISLPLLERWISYRPISGRCQVIMATHSPVLMAYPNATLLEFTKYGLEPTTVEQTYHYRALQEFFYDPSGSGDWGGRVGGTGDGWVDGLQAPCYSPFCVV